MRDDWKEIVLKGLEDSGLNMKTASLKAGRSETFVRDMLKRGKQPSAKNLFTVLETIGIDPAAFMAGETGGNLILQENRFKKVYVTRYVQAGFSSETFEWPEDDWQEVYIPNTYGGELFGAEVRGPSMNKIYAEGTILIFNNVDETQEGFEPGKRYVFQRSNSLGEWEYTVKTLHRDQVGKLWLVPESDDVLQEPVSLDSLDNGEQLKIIGRVIYSIKAE